MSTGNLGQAARVEDEPWGGVASRVVRRRWALPAAGSPGYDLVGEEVLETFKLNQLLHARVDPVVRDCVRLAFHVRREASAVAPSADHDELTCVAVRLPDLEVDEAHHVVDEVCASTEGGGRISGAPCSLTRRRDSERYMGA